MMPSLTPTRPPPVPSVPTETLPLAQARNAVQVTGVVVHLAPEIVPSFWPTRPPALMYWQVPLALQSALGTARFALAVTSPLAREFLISELVPL